MVDSTIDSKRMAKNLLSSVLCLCRCFLGDVDLAEGVLKQVDATCRGLMSPLLRSRQLLLWAQLHYARACCAMNVGQPAVGDVVKTLAACERARALDPLCWRKVNSWSAPPPPNPAPPPAQLTPLPKPLPPPPPAPPYDSQENSQYSWLKYLWFQGACSLWAAQP